MHTDDKPSSTRRGFLARLAGLAAGVGLIAARPSEVRAETAAEQPAEQRQSSGYRETDHIRAYYRSARF